MCPTVRADGLAPSRVRGPVQRLAAGPVPGTALSLRRVGRTGSFHGEEDGVLPGVLRQCEPVCALRRCTVRFMTSTTSAPTTSPPSALARVLTSQPTTRSEGHTSELQSRQYLVGRPLLVKNT